MAEATAEQNYATARDQTKIAYQLTKGNGPGRCVLIHSLAMNGAFWDRVVPLIREHVDVLVYDCRGHGASDRPAGPYSATQFADDLADLLDHVGWDKAIVAGASMGGCISLAFAGHYPDRVSGLGLFDTTAGYRDPEAWAGRGQKAQNEGLAALTDFQKTRWFSDDFRERNPQLVDTYVGIFVANDVDAYIATCGMMGAVDEYAALPKLTMPTEILVGEEDYATPVAMAETLNAEIPQSNLKVIANARHFTPVEVPEEIAAALTKLVKPTR